MATSPPLPPPSRIDKILERAKKEAGSIDRDLAEKVQEAEELRTRRLRKPLVIDVPFFAAIISGQWLLPFQVSMSWKPYRAGADAHKKKKSGLYVSYGNLQLRNPEGELVSDEDYFSIAQILEAGKPEPGYIWIVDWIRSIQSFINWFRITFGWKKLELLDLWGSLHYKAHGGGDDCFLPLVRHPEAVADMLEELSAIIEEGDEAMEELIEREDAKNLRRP
jgi:hypothetical protein